MTEIQAHTSIAPVQDTNRIEFLDVLRGFALFGVLIANLPFFAGLVFLTPSHLDALPTALFDGMVDTITTILVDNKFIGLFSLLFGLGFSLQLGRAEERAVDVRPIYRRRLFWLLMFGLIHGWLLWCWDILRSYAVLGLLLPLFIGLRQKTLLWLAVIIGTLVPASWRSVVALIIDNDGDADNLDSAMFEGFSSGGYFDVIHWNGVYNWDSLTSPNYGAYELFILGRFLLGLWFGRSLIFQNPALHRELHRTITRWGLRIGLALSAVNTGVAELANDNILEANGWRVLTSFSGEIAALALTLGYASGLFLLYQNPRWQTHLRRLAPVGRMALTNYLMQTVVSLWLFYGFPPGPNLMGTVGAALLIPIGCLIFGAQICFSHYWLRRFRFGPMEWLWRSLTYQKFQPLRR